MKRPRRFKIDSSLPRNEGTGCGLPKAFQRLGVLWFALLSVAILGIYGSAWSAEDSSKQKKKYLHPHQVHLEARSEISADFSPVEIRDWPGFMRSLQGSAQILRLDPEAKMAIGILKTDGLNDDEKAIVVNMLNKLLLETKPVSHVKSAGQSGSETKKSEAVYKKTKDSADLKWLNRSILCDIFPQVTRKKRTKELNKITCSTCHEAWGAKAWGQLDDASVKVASMDADSESAVMECISKAIAGKKTVEECVEMVKVVRRSRIEPYGPLQNFIQKSDAAGDLAFFSAVHPEGPYTFKPLLKRLVCIECHSRSRKVDKVIGSDGKVKNIKIFYGAGYDRNQDKETPAGHDPQEY